MTWVDYRAMLFASAVELKESEPIVALSWIAYKNKLSMARWRERQLIAALGPRRRWRMG